MKRHWHVLYGTMIVLFIACAIAIPGQFLPWLSAAVMTAIAMLWHREAAFAQEAVKGMKKIIEFWRREADKAQHELDALIERTRDEEINRERLTVNIRAKSPADFPKGFAHTPSPIEKALAKMYRHARPHTRPLIQNDHSTEPTDTQGEENEKH